MSRLILFLSLALLCGKSLCSPISVFDLYNAIYHPEERQVSDHYCRFLQRQFENGDKKDTLVKKISVILLPVWN